MMTKEEFDVFKTKYIEAFERSNEVYSELTNNPNWSHKEGVRRYRESKECKDVEQMDIIYALNTDYKLNDIPEHMDEMMTIDEYVTRCKSSEYTDNDGQGYYATATQCSDVIAWPDHIRDGHVREDFTHIVWFYY